jgi:hypothetical protein
MVIRFRNRKHEHQFAKQRQKLGIFFIKRVLFVFFTFFIGAGCLQSVFIIYVYLWSSITFAHLRPLSTSSSNRFGMLNDFLLLVIVEHIFFFSSLCDEALKYEIGKSMLIFIYIFIFVNIYQFINKALSNIKLEFLKMMYPSMRQDFLTCLSYLHLRWLLTNRFKSMEEKEMEKQATIDAWDN